MASNMKDTINDTSKAVKAVFDTYELLESILLNASTLDLARCQGLNTAFRSVLQRSQSLQQKLFLSPALTRERCGTKEPGEQSLIGKINPIVRMCTHGPNPYLAKSKICTMTVLSGCDDYPFSAGLEQCQMFMTQPPATHCIITGHVRCGRISRLVRREVIRNDGVRIMDLLAATREALGNLEGVALSDPYTAKVELVMGFWLVFIKGFVPEQFA